MIAAASDERTTRALPRPALPAPGVDDPLPPLPPLPPRLERAVALSVGLAPYVAPLLARLLAGEPLDRDQRGVIVGEVLRLWAMEERLRPTLTAPRAPSR